MTCVRSRSNWKRKCQKKDFRLTRKSFFVALIVTSIVRKVLYSIKSFAEFSYFSKKYKITEINFTLCSKSVDELDKLLYDRTKL